MLVVRLAVAILQEQNDELAVQRAHYIAQETITHSGDDSFIPKRPNCFGYLPVQLMMAELS
jgi:hypothetical protein